MKRPITTPADDYVHLACGVRGLYEHSARVAIEVVSDARIGWKFGTHSVL